MNRAKLIVAFAVCFLVVWCSWLFRYDLKPASTDVPIAYLLDRWTGKTYLAGGKWVEIKKMESSSADSSAPGFTPLPTPPASESLPIVGSSGEEMPVKK